MSSIKNHLILRIILFIFLISYQHNNPFTENFDFIPYKSYIITCITSCCVGVILCVLFQRYCCNTSIIISKEKGHNENTKVKILEQLHLKINNIQENITIVKEEQEQLRTVFNEHKNDLQTISTILTNAIDYQKQQEPEYKECIEFFKLLKTSHEALVKVPSIYWYQKCKEIKQKEMIDI